uniref:CULT domain-containing protein n=1 Tax=Romanomermis culicivorax TaxID=13658 RepID=A0A915HJR6_ROMCU
MLYIILFLDLIFSYVIFGDSELCLCRKCGHEIALADDIITIQSPLAIKKRQNLTLFDKSNVTVHLFKNPAGQKFQVVTFKKADVYIPYDDTWFPPFSWTQVQCPTCGVHLGWYANFDVSKFLYKICRVYCRKFANEFSARDDPVPKNARSAPIFNSKNPNLSLKEAKKEKK